MTHNEKPLIDFLRFLSGPIFDPGSGNDISFSTLMVCKPHEKRLMKIVIKFFAAINKQVKSQSRCIVQWMVAPSTCPLKSISCSLSRKLGLRMFKMHDGTMLRSGTQYGTWYGTWYGSRYRTRYGTIWNTIWNKIWNTIWNTIWNKIWINFLRNFVE